MATGWPLTSAQHKEEYNLMKTISLLPGDAELENYLRVLHEVRQFMLDEIRGFLTDPEVSCLDREAHRHLVERIAPCIENFIRELSGMVDVFLSNFRLLT